MDAAERIMTLAYRLRYAFNSVRSRGVMAFEEKAAEEALDSYMPEWRKREEEAQRRLRTAQTIMNRLKGFSDDWREIWTLKPLALAFFGEGVEAGLHAFWTHYVTIEVATSELGEDNGSDRDYTVSLRRDIFGGGNDTVTAGVESAIKTLEDGLLPIIRTDDRGQVTARGSMSWRG
jgi:hypothetical protein